MRQKQEVSAFAGELISWWSWRPGIKPRNALILGGLISLVALLLACIGLITLVAGIVDSVSQPLQVTGVVAAHFRNSYDRQPHLRIHLSTSGFPGEILPSVSDSAFVAIHDNDHILLDYSPNLHILYALEGNDQYYMLPSSGSLGIFVGAVTLLLLGTVLLLYPAVLAYWGWRDLHDRKGNYGTTAKIISLRAAVQTRTNRPGLTPRPTRTWYGVALCFIGASSQEQVLTFAIREEVYHSLHRGDVVHVTYSPCLHYVYALKPVEPEEAGELAE